MSFLDSMHTRLGSIHSVRRDHIFDDVINLYTRKQGKVLEEYPFTVMFRDEKAVDTGGVTREMFSSFYEKVYLHLFDGCALLYPAMHAGVDLTAFSVIGTALSHAYIIAGILPVRIAFPCLAVALLGPATVIPDTLLYSSFLSSLSAHDASIVEGALQMGNVDYSSSLQDELVSILASQGCRQIPNALNLRSLMVQAARYTLLIQPAAALSMLHSGVPKQHASFWATMSLKKLLSVYQALSVSVSKILNLIEEPFMSSSAQDKVYQYLRRFIGNMTQNELSAFLRFVTGSVVVSVPRITITFNSLQGIARRPISHTCSSTLELSTTYSSLPEFTSEFRSVLSDSYSWRMDAV